MARSFKKIAITLISVSVIVATIVVVYLGYRFSSKSKLALIVPAGAAWVYHFQTKQVRDKLQGNPPPYYDSFSNAVKNLPVFKNIRDPKETGLTLFSDLILFQTGDGWFMCIGINSQTGFTQFLSKNMPSKMHSGMIDKKTYNYSKSVARNMYFAFNKVAIVMYVPSDTIENKASAEQVLTGIFREGSASVSNLAEYKDLMDNNDVLFYSATAAQSHGVLFENSIAKFRYPSKKSGNQMLSPLFLFRKAGIEYSEQEIDALLKPNNEITQNEYLNQSFRTAFYYLKPFTQ